MDSFKFNCPNCRQSLEAPESVFGTQIACPACQKDIPVPDPRIRATPAPSSAQTRETKMCPFCSEEILAAAIKCKHCGEFLDGRSKPTANIVQPPPPLRNQPEVEVWKGNPSYLAYFPFFFFGVLLIPIFGLGLLLIGFAFLDRNTKVFTLTNKRATCKAGILSRQIHEVGTRDIRNINVRQGILARLFNIGNVEIESAAAAGQGHIRFPGISNPLLVRDHIRRQKDMADS